MKKICLFFLFFFFTSQSFSQIKINYKDNPPIIDGEINDWKSAFYTFKQTFHQVKSPNTLLYNFGFDEDYFYGIFQIKDKNLTDLAKDKSGSPRITFNDGIEFYIDTQNNSENVMDDDDFQIIMDCVGNLTVFRGGDKFLIKVEKYKVPKDTITNHFVLDYVAKTNGTVNDNKNFDEGYTIEFRVGWSALGIRPSQHRNFKIDLCLNDADEFLDIKPLPEEAMIPNYAFQSIGGNTNFGFPNQWQKAVLVGEASTFKKIKLLYGNWLWLLFILILMISTYLIIRYLRKGKEIITIKEKVFQVIGEKADFDENSIFSKTEKYILENIEREILANDLAENLNMSLRQLQRQFKEERNTTPTDFIRKIKLEEAAKLLVSSPKNIAQIAYSVGFSDPAYFSRSFKKHFGISPTEFQENAQKE